MVVGCGLAPGIGLVDKLLMPKWAFIAWLACSRRLATKDRLRRWGMIVPASCVLSLYVSKVMGVMLVSSLTAPSLDLFGLMCYGRI